MKFKGVYTVKQNDCVLARSTNQVQHEGFRLVQNWFATQSQQKMQRIDVDDAEHTVSIVSSQGLTSQSMNEISQVFLGYTGKYYYTTSTEDYIRILFKKKTQVTGTTNYEYNLQTRKISAIGIDILRTPMTNQTTDTAILKNANIQLRYSASVEGSEPLDSLSDFTIPIVVQPTGFVKNQVGYNQRIFYFKQPTDISQIKLKFNTFCSTQLRYYIYAINLYQYKQLYTPPTHMTLYDINDKQVFHKQIELSYPNQSYGYSTVFKTTIPYDYLNSTTQIFAISTDYYYNGERKMFSFSEYEAPWSQQQLTNIQLQYQLFFSNTQNSSYNSNSSSTL